MHNVHLQSGFGVGTAVKVEGLEAGPGNIAQAYPFFYREDS